MEPFQLLPSYLYLQFSFRAEARYRSGNTPVRHKLYFRVLRYLRLLFRVKLVAKIGYLFSFSWCTNKPDTRKAIHIVKQFVLCFIETLKHLPPHRFLTATVKIE